VWLTVLFFELLSMVVRSYKNIVLTIRKRTILVNSFLGTLF
jgi:hypothetical protein